LRDLVASKKTQRDKDWLMIRKLLEASYARVSQATSTEQVELWLGELRTPELLVACAETFSEQAGRVAERREATAAALRRDLVSVRAALASEESRERELDRVYWAPLRAELETLRRTK